jgi:hypothetical protein
MVAGEYNLGMIDDSNCKWTDSGICSSNPILFGDEFPI